jgi:hypothetical protein
MSEEQLLPRWPSFLDSGRGIIAGRVRRRPCDRKRVTDGTRLGRHPLPPAPPILLSTDDPYPSAAPSAAPVSQSRREEIDIVATGFGRAGAPPAAAPRIFNCARAPEKVPEHTESRQSRIMAELLAGAGARGHLPRSRERATSRPEETGLGATYIP